MIYTTNYLGVIITAVGSFVIGFLWFGPIFGKKWLALTGFTSEQIEEGKRKGMKGMMKQMITAFVSNLVTAFIFFTLASTTLSVGTGRALCLALLIWIGFSVPIFLNGVLWERKSWSLFWLNSLHMLTTLVLSALVYNWMN